MAAGGTDPGPEHFIGLNSVTFYDRMMMWMIHGMIIRNRPNRLYYYIGHESCNRIPESGFTEIYGNVIKLLRCAISLRVEDSFRVPFVVSDWNSRTLLISLHTKYIMTIIIVKITISLYTHLPYTHPTLLRVLWRLAPHAPPTIFSRTSLFLVVLLYPMTIRGGGISHKNLQP